MVKVRMRKGVNIKRVVKKLVYTLLTLWIGGFIVQTVADTMLGYCSPFFQGFSLFGWKVGNSTQAAAGLPSGSSIASTCDTSKYILYDVTEAGILVIIGIVGVASILMEFVNISY